MLGVDELVGVALSTIEVGQPQPAAHDEQQERDDAEDAETILHEFGHALQDAITPDFGQSEEAAAMGEGFGDYSAASFFGEEKPTRYRPTVMSWDGVTWERVCRESGVRAVPECRDTYSEIFVEGDEPTEPCPIHHLGQALDLWSDQTSFDALDRASRRQEEDELRP